MDASSRTAQLYASLRRAILRLDMVPGQPLTERGLEAAFGASRTPARAALMRLETEGLVQRMGRGWIVSPIDLGEIDALAHFREVLESAGVARAVLTASDGDIAAVVELLGAAPPAADEEESVRAGGDFHVELARLCGNPFIVDAVSTSMVRLSRTRWLEVRTPQSRDQAWREHRHIVEAIARRDGEAATRLVTEHIRATNARLLESLSAQHRSLRVRGLAIVGEDRAG